MGTDDNAVSRDLKKFSLPRAQRPSLKNGEFFWKLVPSHGCWSSDAVFRTPVCVCVYYVISSSLHSYSSYERDSYLAFLPSLRS